MNLADLGNESMKINSQTLSSKFTPPRGCSACHLDCLGNCNVRKPGCSLISTCSCHKHFCVDVTNCQVTGCCSTRVVTVESISESPIL